MSDKFSQNVINKAQTAQPWVRKVAANRYRVTPRTADHGKYELEVSWDRDGNPSVENCFDYRFNEPCKGFYYSNGNCYHAARLLIHLMPKLRRAA